MIPGFVSPYGKMTRAETFDEWRVEVDSMTRSEQVEELSDMLSKMWTGDGEYGVYTKAHEVQRMRHLLHVLLG